MAAWFVPFLCSGNSILLCSIWVAALLDPDICPEMPHAGVLATWAGYFPPLAFLCLSCGHRSFPSLKRNDLQFPATRVRIRHGGDFPGIKQRRSRRGYGNIPALRKGECATPAQPTTRHCDKHSILDLSLKNKIVYSTCARVEAEKSVSLCMRFSISGDSRPLALKSAERSGYCERVQRCKRNAWGGECEGTWRDFCRVHRIG